MNPHPAPDTRLRTLIRWDVAMTLPVGLAMALLAAPLAAVTGLVEPVWAMAAMAASVSVVLANSFAGRLAPSSWRPSTCDSPEPARIRSQN